MFPDPFKTFVRFILLTHGRICRSTSSKLNGESQTLQSGRFNCEEPIGGHKSTPLTNFLSLWTRLQTHSRAKEGKAPDIIYWARLPTDLIIHILSFTAPDTRQCISRPFIKAHVDIRPAMLPSDPGTWPPVPSYPPEEAF